MGVSIRFCSFESANQHVWHILDVEGNSPASAAGLQSNCDYIIGADSVLQEQDDLYTLIEAHENKPLKLFVYNYITDACREVTITPNSHWGGEGSLGCGIGYGYLHRIPSRPINEVGLESTSLLAAEQAQQQYQHQQQPTAPQPPQQPPATTQASGYSSAAVATLASSLANAHMNTPPSTQTIQSSVNQSTVPGAPAAAVSQVPPPVAAPVSYPPPMSSPGNVNNPPGSQSYVAPPTPKSLPTPSPAWTAPTSQTANYGSGVGGDVSMPKYTPPTLYNPVSSSYNPSAALPSYSSSGPAPLPSSNSSQSNPYAPPRLPGSTSYAPPSFTSGPASFTTPLSLPGMPPLTVSATLPGNLGPYQPSSAPPGAYTGPPLPTSYNYGPPPPQQATSQQN